MGYFNQGNSSKINQLSSSLADSATNTKGLGAQGDGIFNNSAIFAGMNAMVKYLIPAGVYYVTQNTTISNAPSIQFAPGAIIKPASGIKLTINAHIVDTMHQIFDVSAGGLIGGLRKNDFVRPEWFGAKGDYDLASDTGTNDSIAFQATVDTIEREILPCLKLSGSRYLFGATVIIRKGGWTLKGVNGVSRPSSTTLLNAFITGVSGLDCLFDYGNNTSVIATNHFEVNGVNLYGQNRVSKLIRYSESGNGPHRGFNVLGSVFGGFTLAGIYFDSTITVSTLCSMVNIEGTYFYGKDYTCYAVYANKPIWGFRFVNNQSEQTAKIYGKINGSVTITDNMLEGQQNTVFIDAGLAQIVIERNYFEANSGDYVIKCATTNPSSSVTVRDNYGINMSSKTNIVTDTQGIVTIRDTFGSSGTNNKFSSNNIHLSSIFKNDEIYMEPTLYPNSSIFRELVENYNYKETYITGATVTKIPVPGTTISVSTPIGSRTVKETSGNSGYYVLNEAVLAGDYVVFNVLLKYKLLAQINVSPLLSVFNSDFSKELTGTISALGTTNYGKFALVTFVGKLSDPTSKLNFLVTANNGLSGGNVDVVQYGEAKVYHLTGVSNFYVSPSIK